MQPAAMTAEEMERRLRAEFPEAFQEVSGLAITEVRHGGARVRFAPTAGSIRPGGTLSGPTLMMLADVAMYVAVLATYGWVPLAVTTSLNINFLLKPPPAPLEAACRLIKTGRRLAVGDVELWSQGVSGMVAHATSTYSIPPPNNGLTNGVA
ncbi:PaaI family thioesterase [Xanthobacteraceae bacterium Astr-EGSB]|uniref:PaaI family thioesterase n=1 Tax=Astrobacterium formosum TaxID=3069710 RepID=UPI0027B5E4D1|nr:PaaI family thioesterase [Xanthobacteraceae bacterium Astr-EGSB]